MLLGNIGKTTIKKTRLCHPTHCCYLPQRHHVRTHNGDQMKRSYKLYSKSSMMPIGVCQNFCTTPFGTRIPRARLSIETIHMPALCRSSLLVRLGITPLT